LQEIRYSCINQHTYKHINVTQVQHKYEKAKWVTLIRSFHPDSTVDAFGDYKQWSSRLPYPSYAGMD